MMAWKKPYKFASNPKKDMGRYWLSITLTFCKYSNFLLYNLFKLDWDSICKFKNRKKENIQQDIAGVAILIQFLIGKMHKMCNPRKILNKMCSYFNCIFLYRRDHNRGCLNFKNIQEVGLHMFTIQIS